MSIATPVIGQNYVIVNQTTTLSNATTGGTWSSSNGSVATIGSSTGVVTGILSGNVTIIYTVGLNIATFYLSCLPANATNGLNTQLILQNANNRITWVSQGSSNSGRFYQDFHALCDETIIEQLNPKVNPTSPEFATILSSLNRSIILDAINCVFNSQQLIDQTQMIFNRSDRLYLQTLDNSCGFVGITFDVAGGDFGIAFKNLILFFNKAMTFNLYLYNDMIDPPLIVFPVTVLANSQTVIPVDDTMLLNFQYLQSTIKGGRWFLGYYQDDIEALGGNAMFYNIAYSKWNIIRPWAFSAPVQPSPNPPYERDFNRYNIGANNLMYGMNAEICTFVDPTNDIVQNLKSGLFDNLFGLMMAAKIIEMIIFSYRNNKTQVNLQGNSSIEQLYAELNATESYGNDDEMRFCDGLRKKIEKAKYTVKKGFQNKPNRVIGCG